MIFTTPMSYLLAAVLREDSDAVAAELLKLGVLHFVGIRDLDPAGAQMLQPAAVEDDLAAVREARRRIDSLLEIAELPAIVPHDTDPADAVSLDPGSVNTELDGLVREMEKVRGKQKRIQQDINRLEEIARQLPLVSSGALQLADSSQNRFLSVRLGTVESDRFDDLQAGIERYPAVVTRLGMQDGRMLVMVAAMKRHDSEVSALLEEAGFRVQEVPSGTTMRDVSAETDVQSRIDELRQEQQERQRQLTDNVRARLPELTDYWQKLRVRQLLLTVHSQFSHTTHAVLFTGWVPSSKRPELEERLRQVTNGRCYLEWHGAREMEVVEDAEEPVPTEGDVTTSRPAGLRPPSELNNPRFLRPFQLLVTNFGIPAYGTVDPTFLVAIAYLVMFALMFGDAGHGFVLVLTGIVGVMMGKRGKLSKNMTLLSRLLIWCGGASMITGVLFGSYFGFEILPPLWFDYHGIVAGRGGEGVFTSIYDILTLTIYFGVAVIGVGLILNWMNLVRTRKWIPLFFDKYGVLGGIIYGVGVWAAAYFAGSGFRALPPGRPLLLGIGVPALLLFARFPLENHGGRPRIGWWFMEWIIEVLEVFAGYLANTLSFMRVAGLGIAHVTLLIAFFQIAEMAAPNGQNAVSIVILVLGNILIIALEGLSSGIQALRLNYYEFFSKYFSPTGTVYKPISLNAS